MGWDKENINSVPDKKYLEFKVHIGKVLPPDDLHSPVNSLEKNFNPETEKILLKDKFL